MNESTWLRLVPANSAKVSWDILANDRFGLFVLAMVGPRSAFNLDVACEHLRDEGVRKSPRALAHLLGRGAGYCAGRLV